MRFLLDAHLSPKRIGDPLRKAGHDVFALAEHPELDGLSDLQVLELAGEDKRILVTRNARDFAPLLRTWAESRRSHPGCILIWSHPHNDYRNILAGIDRCLASTPKPSDWSDLTTAI